MTSRPPTFPVNCASVANRETPPNKNGGRHNCRIARKPETIQRSPSNSTSTIPFISLSFFGVQLNLSSKIMSNNSSGNDDLYSILGVAPEATPKEIRKAYLQKAKELHPDKQQSPDQDKSKEASLRFTGMKDAYDILSDASKKNAYDMRRRCQNSASSEEEETNHTRERPSSTTSRRSHSSSRWEKSKNDYSHARSSNSSSSSSKTNSQGYYSAGYSHNSSGQNWSSSRSSSTYYSATGNHSTPRASNSGGGYSKPKKSTSSRNSSKTSSSEGWYNNSYNSSRYSYEPTYSTYEEYDSTTSCSTHSDSYYNNEEDQHFEDSSASFDESPKKSRSKAEVRTTVTSRVYGYTQQGTPCKNCIRQDGFCHQHVDQMPKSSSNRRSSRPPMCRQEHPKTSRSQKCDKSSRKKKEKPPEVQEPRRRVGRYGVTQAGLPCKRCLKKGDYCYQHC